VTLSLSVLYKYTFVYLLQGVQFLHESCQIAHGSLNTQSCFITHHWSLKLCDYGLNDVLTELAHQNIIKIDAPTVEGKPVA